jgi:hypothetical protein
MLVFETAEENERKIIKEAIRRENERRAREYLLLPEDGNETYRPILPPDNPETAYVRQGNFTICLLKDGDTLRVGVSKRNTGGVKRELALTEDAARILRKEHYLYSTRRVEMDKDDPLVGQAIALAKAVRATPVKLEESNTDYGRVSYSGGTDRVLTKMAEDYRRGGGPEWIRMADDLDAWVKKYFNKEEERLPF